MCSTPMASRSRNLPAEYYLRPPGLPVLGNAIGSSCVASMEEGPDAAHLRQVRFMPVADRGESIASRFHRIHAEAGGNFIMTVIGAALALILIPGRWIAMQTSKVPKWPQEIRRKLAVSRTRDPGYAMRRR